MFVIRAWGNNRSLDMRGQSPEAFALRGNAAIPYCDHSNVIQSRMRDDSGMVLRHHSLAGGQ
jgi:hypothetical protein